MVHTKLLALIVLCLTLFVYTSVQSLETGYPYTNERVMEEDELHEDLKCGYLMGWYTHMRVFKLLLGEPYNLELRGLINPISSTSNVVRSQIISLIGLKKIHIGAMWLVYLFTGLITVFYEKIKNPYIVHTKIVETLFYVVDKLEADQAGCRPGNSFDSYKNVLKSLGKYGPAYYKTNILVQHLYKANVQLQTNDIISDGSLKHRLEINMKINTLLLNNLGNHIKLKNELQNVYNLKINWHNTSAVLLTAWENARYLDWTNTNVYPLRLYYNACYDFLEIIITRLSLKHMTYLTGYPFRSLPFLHYVQQWYNIVVEFSTKLKLSGDSNVYRLLENLRNLIDGTKTLDIVIRFLVTTLITLCQPFGCDAGNEFVIDNQEFTCPYTSLIGQKILSQKKPPSDVPIEDNSLENAKCFLTHLELAFDTVNFSVIRLLIEYIDELNPTQRVVRSEESTSELQSLDFDMEGYE